MRPHPLRGAARWVLLPGFPALVGVVAGVIWNAWQGSPADRFDEVLLWAGFAAAPGIGFALSPKRWLGFLVAPMLALIAVSFYMARVASVDPFPAAFARHLMTPHIEKAVLILNATVAPLALLWLRALRGPSWTALHTLLQLANGLVVPAILFWTGVDVTACRAFLVGAVLVAGSQVAALELAFAGRVMSERVLLKNDQIGE